MRINIINLKTSNEAMAEISIGSLASLPTFLPDSDHTSTAHRWLKRFEILLIAICVTDNTSKRALLLHLAGERVYEILQGLVVAMVAEDADPAVSNEYINAKTALNEYLNPTRNVQFEVCMFSWRETRRRNNRQLPRSPTYIGEILRVRKS